MKLRKLNPLDLAFLVLSLMALVGFGLAKAGYAGVDQVIEGTHKVDISVYLIGLKTLDAEIFKVGEKSAITIRNRPVHPPMTIVKVEHWEHKASFLNKEGNGTVAFPDPAVPHAHDFIITVQDEADATKDGFVIRGNKVKIGNLVELEGFKYRAQGVVVDIKATDSASKANDK